MTTAAAIFRIDAAIRGNKVIYWLSRIPLIKRLVSDTLYEAHEGKLALTIVHWILYVFKSFAGTFLYLFLLCALPLLTVTEGGDVADLFGRFCWVLLWLSFFFGAMFNPFTMEADPLKYTCVRMMGIDARRYHLIQGGFYHLEYFVTFALGLMIASALMGQGALPGLLLAVEMACARLVMEWFHVWVWGKLKKPLYGRVWFTLLMLFGSLAAAYVPAMLRPMGADSWLLSLPAVLIFAALGVVCAVALIRYRNYYRLTLDICKPEKFSAELAQQKAAGAAFNDVKLKDSDLTGEGECASLSGWPYLQALFFRRHRRMMYKPVKFILMGIAAVTVLAAIPLLIFRGGEVGEVFSSVTAALPFCVFFLYIVQNNIIGTRICKAMFYNCDLAMLKFGWYREPAVILKNFVLRFRRICGVNLLLSAAVCAMFTVLTLCAGGQPPLVDYAAFLIAILCLAVFFSVHSIGMYYLFQPYTSDLKVKNPFFGIINGVMYVVCYTCIQIRSTPTWFTPVVLAITVVYSAVILLAVWKRSPKTFRVK